MAMNVLGENIGPAPDARRGKPFKDVVAQLREDCGVAPLTTVNGHNGGPTTCGVQPADVQSAAADAPANGGTPEEPDAAGYDAVAVEVEEPCTDERPAPASVKRTRRRAQFGRKQKPKAETPAKGVTRNALQDGFFAELEDNIVSLKGSDVLAFKELLAGLLESYRPVAFIDKLRVRRLALLHYRLAWLIDRADAAAVKGGLLRYRRAQRLAPQVPVQELLEKTPAALLQTSAGIQYLLDLMEPVVTAVADLTHDAEVITAVQEFAGQVYGALPGFYDVVNAPGVTKAEVLAALDANRAHLELEVQVLAHEEYQLADTGAAIRLVPGSKRYQTILRAARATMREIRYLEWTLAQTRCPFGDRNKR
jgi:hypothetical protein